ncbi:MAG: hypothetical protein RIF33_04235 [Cyclobacteriaceae bacterium]
MSTKEAKLELIEWLVGIDDDATIAALLTVMKSQKRITMEEYNHQLDAAEQRVAAGSYVSQEELKSESREWLD